MDNKIHTINSLGDIIRKARIEKGFTLREFAQRVNVSPTFISLLENNRNTGNPSEDLLRRIADELNLNLSKLIYLIGKIPEADRQKRMEDALSFFRKQNEV